MSEPRRDELILNALLAEIEQGRIRVYRSVFNHARVSFQHPDFPIVSRPLQDSDVRGWLVDFAWDRRKWLLGDREIDRIIEFLAGRSLRERENVPTDPELLAVIEQEPLVELVVEFMHERDNFETKMQDLWLRLQRFAKERSIQGRKGARFPGGANVLSRRLKELAPVLSHLGIDVHARKSDRCIVRLTRRLDDPNAEPPEVPPDVSGSRQQTLGDSGDRQRRIAELRERRNQGRPV